MNWCVWQKNRQITGIRCRVFSLKSMSGESDETGDAAFAKASRRDFRKIRRPSKDPRAETRGILIAF